MTRYLSEDEVVVAVSGLTRARLVAYVEAEIVRPVQGEQGRAYRQVDVARLQLLGDLTENFDLSDDGLAVVMRLIDQLHALRADMRCVVNAILREPEEVRSRLARAVTDERRPPGRG
jgi:chaperone modulatory protein CbpM